MVRLSILKKNKNWYLVETDTCVSPRNIALKKTEFYRSSVSFPLGWMRKLIELITVNAAVY